MRQDHNVSVRGLAATFTNVLLPMGLTLDSVELDAKNVLLDHDPFTINLETPGTITVRLSEGNLQGFLEKEKPGGLHDFKVSLQDGKAHVEAKVKMFVEVRGKATCRVTIVNGTQLWIELEDVEVLGVGAKSLVEKQLEKINPVFDVSSFPLDITLEDVVIYDGELAIRGIASPRN